MANTETPFGSRSCDYCWYRKKIIGVNNTSVVNASHAGSFEVGKNGGGCLEFVGNVLKAAGVPKPWKTTQPTAYDAYKNTSNRIDVRGNSDLDNIRVGDIVWIASSRSAGHIAIVDDLYNGRITLRESNWLKPNSIEKRSLGLYDKGTDYHKGNTYKIYAYVHP